MYPSNYPSYNSGFGAFGQNAMMNSGPPAPPYGNYQQQSYGYSAYNNPMGGMAMGMGMGMQAAMQQTQQMCYSMGHQPPPMVQPPPTAYMANQQMQQRNQQHVDMAMQRQLYQQQGYKPPKTNEDEEEPEEEADKMDIDEEVKARMKSIFTAEMRRRYAISGTFDIVSGTVMPFIRYQEGDPVVEFYKEQKERDLTTEKKGKWNVEADCEYLREAINGLGTNEDIITFIVSHRTNAQRQKILRTYKSAFGEDLIDLLQGDLSGSYREAVMACFWAPAKYDAHCIKRAIYGLGTDEESLIEILLTRTPEQIREMRAVYSQVARPDEVTNENLIEEDIEGDTSGDFKRLLYAAAQGGRTDLDMEELEEAVEEILNAAGDGTGLFEVNIDTLCSQGQACAEAKELYAAGQDKFFGTDETVFIRLFSMRNFVMLKAIYKEYVKLTQESAESAVNDETSGSFKKGLNAIFQSVENRPRYFARRLIKAMKGLGTDEQTLIRIITSRSEIDMVQIKAMFLDLTSKTLWKWIEEDTSFDFKKILQAIVGRD